MSKALSEDIGPRAMPGLPLPPSGLTPSGQGAPVTPGAPCWLIQASGQACEDYLGPWPEMGKPTLTMGITIAGAGGLD